ncbi:MAG: protein kinase domain-containing protein, partial [Candidatus Sumerlaeota bacterium]
TQEYYERVIEVLQPVLDYNPELDSSLSDDTQSSDTSSPVSLRSRLQRLLAAAHASLKEFNKAIDYYQSLLEANPDDPQAIVGLGMAYARMSDTTEEMDIAISRAREIAPEDPLLNYAVGERLAEENRWDAATNCLITALQGDASFTDQILRLTSRFVGRLQGEASIPARWMRVSVLRQLGHYETLLDELEMIDVLDQTERTRILMLFQEILKEAPGNIEALYGRGRILRRLDRYPQARRSLEEALRQDPDYLPAKRMLLEVYSEILKEEDSASLQYAAGQIAMQLEDYDRAVAAFQKARSDPGFERMSRRHLAECFLKKGLIELALAEFQNIAVDNEMKPLLYQLADEFEGVGNVFGARQSLQLIYSLDAGYRDVAERLNRLAQSSQANPELLAQMAAEQRAAVEEQAQMPEQEARKHSEVAKVIDQRTRYDLQEEIGRGAMASVYRAMDNELEEIVALKILPESLIKNPEALRRFRLEARASRKLSHDNIVRIHDIGEEKGRKYISMEFVEGKTLKDMIRAAARDTSTDVPRIAIAKLADYAMQIAAGMQYAHEQGIIHRDLKPANIMITSEDKVKVADFGIAKAVEASDQSQGTITGAIVGTPLYMSPEQIMGETCDRRTDIYSFGVLIYEAIIGHAPFNQGDLAYQHLHVEPDPLPAHVDPVFAEMVMKCLEKDPEQRWQSFDDILNKLSELKA